MTSNSQQIDLTQCKTLSEAYTATRQLLRVVSDTHDLDARLLVCEACSVRYEQLVAYPELEISPVQIKILQQFIQRRLSGEPVSRIFGTKEFWSHSFALNSDTLDPRPDTETLVSFTLELLKDSPHINNAPRILDLGTGTGCILLSLLSEIPDASGVGADISESALKIAKENAETLGLSNRAEFVLSDWMSGISGDFNIVVSNPPYIPHKDIAGLMPEVRKYDPLRALDGGPDGLDAYREIIDQLNHKLYNDTLVIFEIGKNQEKDVKFLLNSYKTGKTFSNISYKCDLTGSIRCIAAKIKYETSGC